MHFGDDANSFMTYGDGTLETVRSQTHHQVRMAERGGGNLDLELVLSRFRDRYAVDQDLTVCLTP